MVDWFKVESVPVSLAFSPTGDFLATAHMDSVGIFLWANRTQFAEVSLRQINPVVDLSGDAALLTMPTTAGLSADDEGAEQQPIEASADDQDAAGVYLAAEQLTDNMVTLSSLPKSKWQTLLNLATIKKRNKPELAPKAPELAPFFLPTVLGTDPRFDLEAKTDNKDGAENKPIERSRISTASAVSGLVRALYRGQETMSFAAVYEYLKELNPSAIDLEIRTLPVDDDLRAAKAFIQASTAQLRSKRDFELVQAYLQVFLNVFGDIIKANTESLEPLLVELRKESKSQWSTIDGLIRYSACMVEFMRTSK
ncbi:rRNA-processing protein utp21 [Coemansia sp. RSA 2052]|nr:rRNA-processing protein utp21 [Coemansia sp. RSA 2052]